MRLQVKGRSVEVSEPVRRYAEGKFKKLERQLEDPEIELELHVEGNPKIPDDHTAEAAVRSRRLTVRAHASARTFEAAIDQLVDKLERQAVKTRERRQRKPAHKSPPKVAAPVPEPD
jgi:putative sigma-54 modulation protein